MRKLSGEVVPSSIATALMCGDFPGFSAELSAPDWAQQEERYRSPVETTERELGSRDGCGVRLDHIGYLSWWRWHFTKHSPSFIFYGDDENDG